ncbi:hypothetical protein T4C_8749, partial [Trichinella pseudospiralis]
LGNGNVKILINGTRQELLFSDQKLENGFAIVVAEKKYFFKCDSMQEKFFWLIDLGLIIRQITAKDGNDALNDVFDTDAIYDAQHQLKYLVYGSDSSVLIILIEKNSVTDSPAFVFRQSIALTGVLDISFDVPTSHGLNSVICLMQVL